MSDTLLIKSYGAATRALGPLTPIWVRKRASAGKEDPDRLNERHGESKYDRPSGTLIWFHAASVGECQMLMPVIERFHRHDPNIHILVTSGTLTSAKLMAERLPDNGLHQYVPLDYPQAVKKFLTHWNPDMAIWAESEIWPNLIRQTKAAGVPMALLNARMSEKSIAGWEKREESARSLFGAFDVILAADKHTAGGLGGILNRMIDMPGNLKDASAPLPYDKAELKRLKSELSRRPVWCAASTHPGEDKLMIKAHQQALEKHQRACLILAPRHPDRGDDIAKQLKDAGLSYVTRASNQPITQDTQVLLFNTIGEMGLAYRLSKVTFVCGSLVNGLSGHNPLEPARLDNAVLTGTHISSFADTYMSMISFDAAERILTPQEIGPRVSALISDKKALKVLSNRALEYAQSRDAVLDYVWDKLLPLIPS